MRAAVVGKTSRGSSFAEYRMAQRPESARAADRASGQALKHNIFTFFQLFLLFCLVRFAMVASGFTFKRIPVVDDQLRQAYAYVESRIE